MRRRGRPRRLTRMPPPPPQSAAQDEEEMPAFWAVVQGKGGVQPWVVSVVPFVQVRPPSTHNQLLLCSIDALGQLQRWKQCEWSDVRAIAPAPHLKEATQAFLLRFQKQLVGKGPKGEKGGRAASDVSGDPSLQSKGRTEQQARGSRRPRPTTTPREAAQAAQAAGDGGGAREKAEILRLEAENKLLREQLKAAEAARKTAQNALTGERALWERREKGWEKQRGELQQQVTATAQVRAVGGGGQRVVQTPTKGSMCCTCRRRRWTCTLHSAPNAMWPSTWGSKRPPSRS